jgi:regulator of replication initiation timing
MQQLRGASKEHEKTSVSQAVTEGVEQATADLRAALEAAHLAETNRLKHQNELVLKNAIAKNVLKHNQDRKKQMDKQEQEHLSEMQVVESQFTLKQASALRTIGQHQHQLDAMRAQFKAVSNENDQHVLEISDLKNALAEVQDQSTEASLTHASALLQTTAQMKENKAVSTLQRHVRAYLHWKLMCHVGRALRQRGAAHQKNVLEQEKHIDRKEQKLQEITNISQVFQTTVQEHEVKLGSAAVKMKEKKTSA